LPLCDRSAHRALRLPMWVVGNPVGNDRDFHLIPALAERFGCRSQPLTESDAATPAMIDDSLLPFSLPSVDRNKITAAFDGGRISSDGGVMLLALAERRMGIADRLAAEITDRRDPTPVVHALSDILRARILAIACGYEDADDLDHLRSDPALKLACGHLPDSGRVRSR